MEPTEKMRALKEVLTCDYCGRVILNASVPDIVARRAKGERCFCDEACRRADRFR